MRSEEKPCCTVPRLVNQRDLATSYIVVGDALAEQGQHKAALEHYVRGFEIRRNLVVADPGNQAWQRDLAIGYNQIGQAHQILGERAEALAAYQQGVALRQRLADANRDSAQWQSELAVSLYLLSSVSEPSAAKDALRKALAILETLERDQKLTSMQATWPKFIRGEIAKLP